MLREYKALVNSAANGGTGVTGTASATAAPGLGQPVLHPRDRSAPATQEAVVEGVRPSDTRKGPGQCAGHCGLGQPGNAVVVGRASGFGEVQRDWRPPQGRAELVATTTQGQSVYQVTSVKTVSLHNPSTGGSSSTPQAIGAKKDDSAGLISNVYGPSNGDQLRPVTSASDVPWNTAAATVVVAAALKDKPFPADDPGGACTASEDGAGSPTTRRWPPPSPPRVAYGRDHRGQRAALPPASEPGGLPAHRGPDRGHDGDRRRDVQPPLPGWRSR